MDGKPCAPLCTTWFSVLCGHMCKHDRPLCDRRVASPSCPPGLVCLLTSLITVKSLFEGSWRALPVCLSVVSPRWASQRAGSPLLSLQPHHSNAALTHHGGSYVICGRLFVLTQLDFTMCIFGQDLKTLLKPNAEVHLFPCF